MPSGLAMRTGQSISKWREEKMMDSCKWRNIVISLRRHFENTDTSLLLTYANTSIFVFLQSTQK